LGSNASIAAASSSPNRLSVFGANLRKSILISKNPLAKDT
jgi:hypothetical protein